MAKTTPDAFLTTAHAGLWGGYLARLSFQLFLVISLISPSWRYGILCWWPVLRIEELGGGPVNLGILNLLPVLAATGWLVTRIVGALPKSRPLPPWDWGSKIVTLPMLGLTILGLLSLSPDLERNTLNHLGMAALTWFVYFFVINEKPPLTLVISIIVLVQGSVATGQFFAQRDLGLTQLGELPLHPAWEGISVLTARGQPWLRAYGLTPHPNILGAMLCVLLLILLPTITTRPRLPYFLFHWLVITIGLTGLLLSYSRAAWLAFGVGLVTWLIFKNRGRTDSKQPVESSRRIPSSVAALSVRVEHLGQGSAAILRAWGRWLLVLLPPLALFLLYSDLTMSRFFSLDTPTEAQSINERVRDVELALRIIAVHPWTGVGLGRYLDAAQALDADAAMVHNVPLLVTAESGIMALVLWILLAIAPFVSAIRRSDPVAQTTTPDRVLDAKVSKTFVVFPSAGQLAPWAAMIVVNLFDTTLWWGTNWQTSMLFALLAAHLSWNLIQGTLSPSPQGRSAPSPLGEAHRVASLNGWGEEP
jgi:O-antigen ligase